MKNKLKLVISIIFFSSFSLACNNDSIQKTLEYFCTELSKLKIEQIASVDALPEKNLQLNACGPGVVVIYSSQKPYKIIRHPMRSWNNGTTEFEHGADVVNKLTEEALLTKKMSSIAAPYGPKSFEIEKKYYALACEGGEKNYPYLAAATFLVNKKNEYSTSIYFLPPEYEKYKLDYDTFMDLNATYEKRSKSFSVIYDKMVEGAVEHLVKNFSINKDVLNEYLLSDDTRMRNYNTVVGRYVKEKARVTDIQGAIRISTETNLIRVPLIDTANKLITELALIKNQNAESKETQAEIEKIKKLNTEMNQKLKEMEAEKIEFGKPNNYTYAVISAIVFFLTSLILLIILKRNR